jgi:putative transport protein
MWIVELFRPPSNANSTVVVASAVLIIMLVAFAGLLIGSIKVRGIGLGIAGVLFAGLAFGHFKLSINHEILHFAREFGLILFVYTIGMQVGPGFFASLKRNGLPLNMMAAGVVLSGAAIAVALWAMFMTKQDLPAAVGLLSGAVTNTPSLAAANGALGQIGQQFPDRFTPAQLALPQQAYAVAYPFGIMGIILAMLLIKALFRVNLQAEQDAFAAATASGKAKLEAVNIELKNPNLHGRTIKEIPLLENSGVVISRVLRQGKIRVAGPDSVVEQGDVMLAVGPQAKLDELTTIVGGVSKTDLRQNAAHILSQRVLVTQKSVIGRTVEDLELRERFDVNVTRIHRNEIELPVTDAVKLQFGDNLVVVGEGEGLKQAAAELGNSPKHLNHPQVIPIFIGIALGVLLGMVPVYLPHAPVPVKLGLAGGPMVVAIILSRIGRIGPFVWYMPLSANFMLRELGIVLFLACVGLSGGETFVASLKANGLQWFAFGALITFLPLIVVGLIARATLRINFMTICGTLAGSMTDPPALAFAGTITGSEAPSIAYATVYPLTMLLRVLTAQLIVLIFCA